MNELDIFAAAWEVKSPAARARVLDETCGTNEELRQRICRLLNAADREEGFMEAADAADQVFASVVEQYQTGTQVGPYTLREKLGEGGMGVVFVAEQDKPIKRSVAIKIIKPGMNNPHLIERFDIERQSLALMDHPNIAKVLDAGSTIHGQPYFVMELVMGLSITQHCDQYRLAVKQRLQLFIKVCEAIQHAHQQGVIHRDLKPTNILVTQYEGRPTPKVIDFGIAKAINQANAALKYSTQFGSLVGTLEYMSPEQAERKSADIDARTDVYSLGGVLYELLTGETPFDAHHLRSVAMDELVAIIRDQTPQRPSIRLGNCPVASAVAACRGESVKQLRREIHGDLDWITLKCLEKQRDLRYATPSALSADIGSYLENKPILARAPTFGVRFLKLYRRNRVAAAAGGAILAVVVAATLMISWLGLRVWQAESTASEYLARLDSTRKQPSAGASNVSTTPLAEMPGWVDLNLSVNLTGNEKEGFTERGYRMTIQPDGKILICGVIAKNDLQSSQDFLVARFHPDGSRDSSFNQIGFLTIDLGLKSRDFAKRIALLENGDIIVAGTGLAYDSQNRFEEGTFCVARISSSGIVLNKLVKNLTDFDFRDLRTTQSGQILMLSYREASSGLSSAFTITCLRPDLSTNSDFGLHGVVSFDVGELRNASWQLELQSDGKVIAFGNSASGDARIVRLLQDGSLDTNFADNGTAHITHGPEFQVREILLDKQDRCYYAASSISDSSEGVHKLLIARLDSAGQLDSRFGKDGIFASEVEWSWDARRGIVFTIDEERGWLYLGGSLDGERTLARLSASGTLDETFASNGELRYRMNATRLHVRNAVVDRLGRILITGEADIGSTLTRWDLLLYRLNPNVVFADGFESSLGSWVRFGKKNFAGEDDWKLNDWRVKQGLKSIQVDGIAEESALTIRQPIDLADYVDATLTFSRYLKRSLVADDFVALDFLDDSGIWKEVRRYKNDGVTTDRWIDERVHLGEFKDEYLHSAFRFRFRATIHSSDSDAFIDDVQLIGDFHSSNTE